MSIRVNPDTRADLLALLNETQLRQQKSLAELSTGRRVNLPSDDPSAAAAMIDDIARAASGDQYVENIDTVREWLTTADSSLNSVVTALQRAMTLAVEGATETQSTANRLAIANDVRGIKDQIFSLANLSFRSRYVFGGSITDAAPYVLDSTAPSGVAYHGNTEINQVVVGERRTAAVNMPGSSIFGSPGADVFSSLENLAKALEANSTDAIKTAANEVRGSFDHVVSARVFYGNAINQIDADQTFLKAEIVQLQSDQNSLVGADPAKSVSDLQQAQWAREATLAAAARSSNLSLLDYLK